MVGTTISHYKILEKLRVGWVWFIIYRWDARSIQIEEVGQ